MILILLIFDNLDLFVSTASGKDTLHDTFGIVIQDIPTDGEMVLSESKYNDPEDNEESRKWRRKTLFARHNDIAPYHKQPKIFNEPMLELGNLRWRQDPKISESEKHEFYLDDVSFHWNTKNPNVGQYLPQIEASPIRHDVVKETLERSLRLKEEGDQK